MGIKLTKQPKTDFYMKRCVKCENIFKIHTDKWTINNYFQNKCEKCKLIK